MEADERTLSKKDQAMKKKYQDDLEKWKNQMKVAVEWHDKFIPTSSGGHLLTQHIKLHNTISEARAPCGLTSIPPNTEAFAMLMAENGEQRHQNIAKNLKPGSTKKKEKMSRKRAIQESDPDKMLEGKWTSQFKGKVPYGSWAVEGKKRFKELTALVSAARSDPNCQALEEEILARVRVKHGLPRERNAQVAPAVAQAAADPEESDVDVIFDE